ncbi:MAG: patatin-like phospholipase family protein [Ignavibacteriales bacterium]|nr:patatin-like phospholipase family protein [Ignavibacteriales bacterium]
MKRRCPFALLAALVMMIAEPSQAQSVRTTKKIEPEFSRTVPLLPNFLPYKSVQRPKIAVVLSGGGARGVSSIGVLKVLEQAEIPIDLIVGTSIGSILGGLYASGYSIDQLRQMVDTTNWADVLSFNDDARRSDLFLDQKIAEDRSVLTVRFQGLEPILPQSLSTGQRLTNYLNLLVLQGIYHPYPSFDDLRIPFRAVTTDLVSGKAVVLDRGDLTEALRASTSVPLLFSPVPRDSARLLDGGLVSNIPVDAARNWGADLIIAVDVTSPLRPAARLNAAWEIADQILGITMQAANKQQLADANVIIRPNLGAHLSDDFTNLDSLIAAGEASTKLVLDSLRAKIAHMAADAANRRPYQTVFRNTHFKFDALSLDQEWIVPVMGLARGSEVSEQALQALVNAMYQSGDFEDVHIDVGIDSGATTLQLIAVQTPVVRSVEITGNRLVGLDTLKGVFRPLLAHRLNFHQSRKAIENVLSVYRDRGYSLARIREAMLDRSSGVATVRIDEGIVYRRDIRGTTKTKDYVIWRELPWNEQEVFQVREIAQGISNLYGTNLFEQVSIDVRQEGSENEHQVVLINVRERSTELIRLGMRIDGERGIQPSVDVRDENLFGAGADLGFRAFGGARNRSFVAEFKATRIFSSYLTLGVKGYYTLHDVNVYGDDAQNTLSQWNRIRVGEYRELRQGASATFGTQLERLGTVTVEGRLENLRVWSFFGEHFATQSYKIGALRFGVKVDNQDRYPYPRKGVLMDFSYESAVIPATGGTGYTKMSFSYDWYQTYGRSTLHPRVRFGFADETLPITEQFSLGGQESFFGLREENSRGRQLLVASLEYRYHSPVKLFFETHLFARYDFGSIWPAPAAVRLVDLRHGVGIGVALDTPVGPVQFSLGQSFFVRKEFLDTPISRGPLLGYFSIGYAF